MQFHGQPLGRFGRYQLARTYRKALKVLTRGDTELAMTYFARTAGFLPGLSRITVSAVEDAFLASTETENLYFPSGTVPSMFAMSVRPGYAEWIRSKYTRKGLIEVEAGDTVVDCGAFVGAFSVAVASKSSQVHAIEPSPVNFRSLTKNLRPYSNATTHNIGLFNADKITQLNLSSSHVDDSLISVDAEAEARGAVDVQVRRLDTWAEDQGIDRIDFLKIEAEGVEPEIVDSIGALSVRKVAADCGPERDGRPTSGDVSRTLRDLGFQCTVDGHMVFGLRDSL